MYRQLLTSLLLMLLMACSESNQTRSSDAASSMVAAHTQPENQAKPEYTIEYRNNLAGLVNKNGEIIIPFEYSVLRLSKTDNLVMAKRQDESIGFLDMQTGAERIPFKYRKAKAFSEGLAGVSEDGQKMGFIDVHGQWVIPPQYDWQALATYEFTQGSVVVYQNQPISITNPLNQQTATFDIAKGAVINAKNEIVVPFDAYDELGDFYEGMALVSIKVKSTGYLDNGKMDLGRRFGYINPKGELVVPTIYYDAAQFHEGVANVALKDKYGFIDKQGQTVIPFEYDNILHSYFRDGFAPMNKRGSNGIGCSAGVIDKNNRVIVPFKYGTILNLTAGQFNVTDCHGKKLELDYKGNRI